MIISATRRILLFSIFGAVVVHVVAFGFFGLMLPPVASAIPEDTDLSVQILAIRTSDQAVFPQEKRALPASPTSADKGSQNSEILAHPNKQGNEAGPPASTSAVEAPHDGKASGKNIALSAGATESVLALIAQKVQANLRYPAQARRRGVQGTVHLSLLLRNDGHAIKIHISTGSGSTILDADAQALLASVLPVAVPEDFPFERPILIAIQYQLN